MRWNKNDHNEIGQVTSTEEKESKRVQQGTRVRDSLVQTLKDLWVSLNWKLLEAQRTWCRPMKALCMLFHSRWVHLTFDHVHLVGFNFLAFPIPFCSYILSAFISLGFLKNSGEGFKEDILFMSECFQISHSLLNALLWVSLFLPSCYCKKLLWWWLNFGYSIVL